MGSVLVQVDGGVATLVLNRPEDQLDTPGILEQSVERGASNPGAGWAERRTN